MNTQVKMTKLLQTGRFLGTYLLIVIIIASSVFLYSVLMLGSTIFW